MSSPTTEQESGSESFLNSALGSAFSYHPSAAVGIEASHFWPEAEVLYVGDSDTLADSISDARIVSEQIELPCGTYILVASDHIRVLIVVRGSRPMDLASHEPHGIALGRSSTGGRISTTERSRLDPHRSLKSANQLNLGNLSLR